MSCFSLPPDIVTEMSAKALVEPVRASVDALQEQVDRVTQELALEKKNVEYIKESLEDHRAKSSSNFTTIADHVNHQVQEIHEESKDLQHNQHTLMNHFEDAVADVLVKKVREHGCSLFLSAAALIVWTVAVTSSQVLVFKAS